MKSLATQLNKLIEDAKSCKKNGLDRPENWYEVAGLKPKYFDFAEGSLFQQVIEALAAFPSVENVEASPPPVKFIVISGNVYFRCRSLEQASRISTNEHKDGYEVTVYEVTESVKFKNVGRY